MTVDNLKAAIDYLKREVSDDYHIGYDGQDYFSGAHLSFENDWNSLKETGKEDEIVEEIISQLTLGVSERASKGYVMVSLPNTDYKVYADYGVDELENFFISIGVVDYSKDGTNEYTILNTDVRTTWDDDTDEEHGEHHRYLKSIAEEFLRIVNNIKIDGRLGKLLFLKSWKQIIKRSY